MYLFTRADCDILSTPSLVTQVVGLKLVIVGVSIPWEVANKTNQGCFLNPESWLLNIYQHSTTSIVIIVNFQILIIVLNYVTEYLCF